jgi:hypothetical protein
MKPPIQAHVDQWLTDEAPRGAMERVELHIITQLAREAHERGMQFAGWPRFTERRDETINARVIRGEVWLIPQ